MRELTILFTSAICWIGLSAQPIDLGVALFDHRDYEGQHIFITSDWSSNELDLPFGIESVRIPKGWEVWLYEGSDFSGRHRSLKGSWDGNGSKDWQWRNDIQSVRIVSTYRPSPFIQSQYNTQGLAVFAKTGYRGDHEFITRDWTQVDGCFAFGIESIRVPIGWEVWIYDGDNFSGRHKKLTENWNGESYDDWRWRNDIRSIRIVRSNIAWNPYTPPIPTVKIYNSLEKTGAAKELTSDWTVSSNVEGWNDRIRAIDIPEGYEVHIFEHAYFRGKMKILRRNWKSDGPDDFWYDRISSIRIVNTGHVQR